MRRGKLVSTNDLKKGIVLSVDGELYSVLEYQHHKPGKGKAVVRTKLRNIRKDSVIDKTFQADDKVEDVELSRRKMQYLFNDGDMYTFMDTENFEQMTVSKEFLGGTCDYLMDEMIMEAAFVEEELISIEPPMFVEMKVTFTEPGLKGDSVSSTTKPATLETGLQINVPLFINIDDVLKVDTRSGKYIERVNQ